MRMAGTCETTTSGILDKCPTVWLTSESSNNLVVGNRHTSVIDEGTDNAFHSVGSFGCTNGPSQREEPHHGSCGHVLALNRPLRACPVCRAAYPQCPERLAALGASGGCKFGTRQVAETLHLCTNANLAVLLTRHQNSWVALQPP